jgi:hypothetical protein
MYADSHGLNFHGQKLSRRGKGDEMK